VTAPSEATNACPGCGLELPRYDGPTHAYIGASPACWALYGELLAREYGELRYPPSHRLTVDVYAVQHPGAPERRAIQSVAVHLIALCLVLERGVATVTVRDLMQRVLARPSALEWLEPPAPNGTITVRDVLASRDLAEHAANVERWARDVWDAWSPHHARVRGWIEAGLS
jgi:uncharacterized protein DUF5946